MCLKPVKLSKLGEPPSYVPCGRCIECLEAYSREWTYRMMLELKAHSEACFVTLTYENNPVDLSARDHQLFMKNLRQKVSPKKIRFFMCGEYGAKGNRPHYHYILFGWRPDDLVPFKITDKGSQIYLSKTVSDVWGKGFITVGDVTPETCKYTAKYLQKLDERQHEVPAFTRCSNRPGIGYFVYESGLQNMLQTDKVYTSAGYYKTPRYFLKLMERDGIVLDELKAARLARGALRSCDEAVVNDRIQQATIRAEKAGITKVFIKKQKAHKECLTVDKINGIIGKYSKRFEGLVLEGGEFDDVSDIRSKQE